MTIPAHTPSADGATARSSAPGAPAPSSPPGATGPSSATAPSSALGDPSPQTPSSGSGDAAVPAIRVHGRATPEEVAALVAVLSVVSAGGDDPEPRQNGSGWASHRAALRTPVPHGPGAWRTSGRS